MFKKIVYFLIAFVPLAIQAAPSDKVIDQVLREGSNQTLIVNQIDEEKCMISLEASGFSKNQEISFYQRNALKNCSLKYRGFADEAGVKLYCPDITSIENLHLYLNNMGPGEPTDLILTNDRGTEIAVAHIVTNPLEVSDSFGRKISAEITMNKGLFYKMTFSGFKPYETFDFRSESNGEVMANPTQCDKDGSLIVIYSPKAKGRGGISHLTFSSDSMVSPLELKLPWVNQWGAIEETPEKRRRVYVR